LASRDAERGQAAIDDIVRDYDSSAAATVAAAGRKGPPIRDRLELLVMDTSSTASVRQAAASLPAGTKLYGIINNAGVSIDARLFDFNPFISTFYYHRSRCSFVIARVLGLFYYYVLDWVWSDHERGHPYELLWPATRR
jgi:hypothetical protein